MAAVAQPRYQEPLTFDDIRDWPEDELPGELDRGEWIPMTRPGRRHGRIMSRIARLLDVYLDTHPIGEAFAGDTGVELLHDPDTLRGPDLGFVANERIPEGDLDDEWLQGAPDMVVEIVSKSQTFRGAASRIREYLDAGARLVWVVDPKSLTVTAFSPTVPPHTVGVADELEGGQVLPGFQCRVSDIFRRSGG